MTGAVVFASTGEMCVAECVRSAESIRRHMPDFPICLLTDRPVESPHLTQVIVDPALSGDVRPKLFVDRLPFERILYLDSDTYVTGELGPVFQLLDRFDFAAYQYSSGYHYDLPGVPNTFPEFNGGIFAFKRGDAVSEFFRSWRAAYSRMGQRQVDQPSLRLALYESSMRLATLPPEYNFIPYFPNYATDRIRIFHGRPHEKLLELDREMNRRLGYRFYSPGLGCTPIRQAMSAIDVVRLSARAIATGGAEMIRRPQRRRRKKRAANE